MSGFMSNADLKSVWLSYWFWQEDDSLLGKIVNKVLRVINCIH